MNPGPPSTSVEDVPAETGRLDEVTIETINVSNLERSEQSLMERTARVCFLQEHTLREGAAKAAVARFRKEGYTLRMGCSSDESGQPTAGIAAVIRQHQAVKLIEIPVRTEEASVYVKAGRYVKYRLVVPGGQYTVHVVYGYTNSHTDVEQRAKSVRLFDAVLAERRDEDNPPGAIVGDFNCDLDDIPALDDQLATGALIDIGQLGSQAERDHVMEGTCLANGAKERTRRDHVLLDQRMASRVIRTWTDHSAGFEVHSP